MMKSLGYRHVHQIVGHRAVRESSHESHTALGHDRREHNHPRGPGDRPVDVKANDSL
jgi:hypothetical protein